VTFVNADDPDGDGNPEWAVAEERDSDGKPAVEIRNAIGAKNTERKFYLSEAVSLRALFNLGDLDSNGVEDLAGAATMDSDGTWQIEIRNARGTSNKRTFSFNP
jgi:hypothetical protein